MVKKLTKTLMILGLGLFLMSGATVLYPLTMPVWAEEGGSDAGENGTNAGEGGGENSGNENPGDEFDFGANDGEGEGEHSGEHNWGGQNATEQINEPPIPAETPKVESAPEKKTEVAAPKTVKPVTAPAETTETAEPEQGNQEAQPETEATEETVEASAEEDDGEVHFDFAANRAALTAAREEKARNLAHLMTAMVVLVAGILLTAFGRTNLKSTKFGKNGKITKIAKK